MTVAADVRPALLAALVRELGRAAPLQAAFNAALAPRFGIAPTDLDTLALLQELGPSSAGQLADVLDLTTGAITGVIDRLVAAGFVVRESDPSDRRRVIVQPVAERVAELERAYEPLVRGAAQALSVYTNDDLRLVLDFHRRAGQLLQQETNRLKLALSQTPVNADFQAPLGQTHAGTLEFANGASGLRVFASDRPGLLYHAVFEGPQPTARVQEGTVSFRYRRMSLFEWGKHAGSVGLNATIPWTISVRDGASNVVVDARTLQLRQVTFGGGANKLELQLPAPVGTVPVVVDGGASRVQIHRDQGVPVQLRVRGGANRLEFDQQRFGAVGGDVRLATPGWELAADRYDIDIRGGASRLDIASFQEVL